MDAKSLNEITIRSWLRNFIGHRGGRLQKRGECKRTCKNATVYQISRPFIQIQEFIFEPNMNSTYLYLRTDALPIFVGREANSYCVKWFCIGKESLHLVLSYRFCFVFAYIYLTTKTKMVRSVIETNCIHMVRCDVLAWMMLTPAVAAPYPENLKSPGSANCLLDV